MTNATEETIRGIIMALCVLACAGSFAAMLNTPAAGVAAASILILWLMKK